MRVGHRTNAAEPGMAAARNLLHPDRAGPFAPAPYFWSDQHELKIQTFGYQRGHDEERIVEGRPARRAFPLRPPHLRDPDRSLATGMPPKALRRWRTAIAARADRHAQTEAVTA
ncbi:oxidoreductase C-terminal domain-containing protein [Streptomyces sp. NPDC095613]|uniref:oxidoreductase C-terminal domain-containing protein n=1 Tax=Streptomyces sp. NPDC095613 TaxID=3155540 RepID=UPI00331F9413